MRGGRAWPRAGRGGHLAGTSILLRNWSFPSAHGHSPLGSGPGRPPVPWLEAPAWRARAPVPPGGWFCAFLFWTWPVGACLPAHVFKHGCMSRGGHTHRPTLLALQEGLWLMLWAV